MQRMKCGAVNRIRIPALHAIYAVLCQLNSPVNTHMLQSHVLKFLRFRSFIRPFSISTRLSSMKETVLVSKFNPINGKLEWDLQPEEYDYVQEIARSGFADMLHDEERNLKYNLALQKAMTTLKQQGKDIHVLDIGTGTGLLAIMGAKAGATHVTACETFQPMAQCAKQVIVHNHCEDSIHLIPKRSTDIVVGSTGDMPQRANILVTEVFDTELIGEGAIGTFNHAHKSLLAEDSIVVPARATIFAQVVESKVAADWNRLSSISFSGKTIVPPKNVATCPGNGAVHDLQLAQFSTADFTPLSLPTPIFNFDWNSKNPIPNDESRNVTIETINTGTANALFMWWTLDMDVDGEIELSCAPPWAHPDGESLPWRDHWMQALYYFPQDRPVENGVKYQLKGYHDEYSLWFDVQPENEQPISVPRPFCNCSIHNAVSRTRLGQINDERRQRAYISAVQKAIDGDSVCLVVGDCSFLALVAATLGARKVYALERHSQSKRFLHAWIAENDLSTSVSIVDESNLAQLELKANVVLGEPFYDSSILPWHNLYFINQLKGLKQFLAEDVRILPSKAHIYAAAIEMKDLWKIRAPVYKTQGVDLLHFDKLIEDAIDASDSQVEPHPLWEYPCRALSAPVRLLTVDLASSQSQVAQVLSAKGQEALATSGTLNGVALWIDWQLDEANTVTGGPVAPVSIGQNIAWDIHSKQAVYFFQKPFNLSGEDNRVLSYSIEFLPDTYDVKIAFSPEPVSL